MSETELVEMLRSGDLYGLMKLTLWAWQEKNHPGKMWATVVLRGDGVGESPVVVPVTAPTASASSS